MPIFDVSKYSWFNVVPTEPGFYLCRQTALPAKAWLVRVEEGRVVELKTDPPYILASDFEKSIMQFAFYNKG